MVDNSNATVKKAKGTWKYQDIAWNIKQLDSFFKMATIYLFHEQIFNEFYITCFFLY